MQELQKDIVESLEQLRDGDSETAETKGDGGDLLVNIMSYSFFFIRAFLEPLAERN